MAKAWLTELTKRLKDRRPSKESNLETGEGTGGETRESTLKRLGIPDGDTSGNMPQEGPQR